MKPQEDVKPDEGQSASTVGLGTGQFRFRSVTAHIAVVGVSGNAKQRRKIMRHWERFGYDPVRFYMNAEQVPNDKVTGSPKASPAE